MTVVADLNHFDEEQDPDLHHSEKLDLDPHLHQSDMDQQHRIKALRCRKFLIGDRG
jgi:hypothetical protein